MTAVSVNWGHVLVLRCREVRLLRVDSGDERPSVLNTLTVSVED